MLAGPIHMTKGGHRTAMACAIVVACCAGEAGAVDKTPPAAASGPIVIVAKANGNTCFSDTVRATGFLVARRVAVVGVDTEGFRVSTVLVKDGDTVTEGQELARLIPPQAPGAPASNQLVPLRATAAGLIVEVRTQAGAPASPQAGPMFRIAVGGDIELDAEVPSVHLLKLNPGAPARITRDDGPALFGKVRVVAPEIDQRTQLGRVRLSIASSPSLKIGTFAKAAIDARRSCGVAVPRSAIDHLTVQVVKNNVIETRRVKTGLVSETSTEILEGVADGEMVVANAGTSLHDGDQIRSILADDLDRSRAR